MDRFEEELKNALLRHEPPDGFADRVLARTAKQARGPHGRRNWWGVFTLPVLRWAAVAAVSAALIIGGLHYHNVQRERAEGEAAKDQLMLALRIAGSKLQLARSKVQQINDNGTDNRQEKE